MGRLCERPGCSEVGVVGYGFDADRLLVWLMARDVDAPRDDLRSGSLCRRHADAMVVPIGWTLDDRREPTPRLFRPAPAGEPARPAPRRRRPRTPRPAASPTPTQAPARPALPLAEVAAVAEAPTVADIAGPSTTDPDETVAIPWMPTFDVDDDLGGVLHAETPLLARAFQGPGAGRRRH